MVVISAAVCLLLVVLLAVRYRIGALVRSGSPRSAASGPAHLEDNPERPDGPSGFTLGEDVLIDISARYSEAIVSNIDAIDTGLIGILALPVAFGVFAVDKIQELHQPFEGIAIALLTLSAFVSFVGYGWGFLIRGGHYGIHDGIYPRSFLAEYTSRGSEAVREAIGGLNDAGDQNASIRFTKRWIAVLALILFLGAAATVFAARLAR